MLLLNSIAPIIGVLSWIIYKVVARQSWFEPLSLGHKKLEISTMVSGFSYTTLGLLAAVIAILFSFVDRRTFKRYKNHGFLSVFMSLYLVTILSLVATAFLALYNYSPRETGAVFNLMLVFFATNVMQALFVVVIIFTLTYKALSDDSPSSAPIGARC